MIDTGVGDNVELNENKLRRTHQNYEDFQSCFNLRVWDLLISSSTISKFGFDDLQ